MKTKCCQNSISYLVGISSKQKQVTWLRISSFFNLCICFIIKEFDDWALFLAIARKGNPCHALCTISSSNISQFFDFSTAPIASALRIDALNQTARLSHT